MTIQQDIDKLFKKGLADYTETPPAFVWDNIERSLNKKRIKRKRNILYSIAASVALLISFGAGFMFTTFQSNVQVASNINPPTELVEVIEKENTILNESGILETDSKAVENSDIKPVKIEPPVTAPSIEQKIETPAEKPVDEPKSNVKKATSSGTLLPPMFAGTSEFQLNNATAEHVQITDEKQASELNIVMLEMKSMQVSKNSNARELNYDYRQLQAVDEYTMLTNESKDYTSWSVGMAVAPLYSYREVGAVSSENLKNADVNSNYEQDYANEKPLLSYSAGVNVNYKVAKRWRIQSGLYFSEMGQISKNVTLYGQSRNSAVENSSYTVNTSTGNIQVQGSQNDLIDKFSEQSSVQNDYLFATPLPNLGYEKANEGMQTNFVQTYEFYEVPFVLNYIVVDRKLSMSVSGGLSANVLYDNAAYVENDGDRYELDAQSEDLNKMNYSSIFGFGLEYPIINRLKFNFQPTLRYSLSSINVSGSVYPYSFGIYSGLRYNF
jgi:hypothetical protein